MTCRFGLTQSDREKYSEKYLIKKENEFIYKKTSQRKLTNKYLAYM